VFGYLFISLICHLIWCWTITFVLCVSVSDTSAWWFTVSIGGREQDIIFLSWVSEPTVAMAVYISHAYASLLYNSTPSTELCVFTIDCDNCASYILHWLIMYIIVWPLEQICIVRASLSNAFGHFLRAWSTQLLYSTLLVLDYYLLRQQMTSRYGVPRHQDFFTLIL